MKFRVHDGNSNDYFDLEGNNINELSIIARRESSRRKWCSCWSERLKEEGYI